MFVLCLPTTEYKVSRMHYPGISFKKLDKTREIIRRVASGILIRHSEIQAKKVTAALTSSVNYLHKTKQTFLPCSLRVNKTYPLFSVCDTKWDYECSKCEQKCIRQASVMYVLSGLKLKRSNEFT